ncbi:hypothetical protein MAR621_03693 [Maribacter dokdonensis]|uniref:hypothetical protein n=1 Tax=Maribacter dokdonensis TaxID=320912 RepID=UPI001B2966A7|nr:hypothetical protein [Maribacter dokdonensis]CAG2533940.1 hypothetical protein MAR621_03693 [Maribacter dokdonensis]
MKKTTIIKFFAITTILYFGLNLIVYYRWEYRNNKIEKELLQKYDTDGDGSFSMEESNPELNESRRELGRDTARGLAPFTLIPISLILGLIVTWIYSILKKRKKLLMD